MDLSQGDTRLLETDTAATAEFHHSRPARVHRARRVPSGGRYLVRLDR
jgi:hypothetical protein